LKEAFGGYAGTAKGSCRGLRRCRRDAGGDQDVGGIWKMAEGAVDVNCGSLIPSGYTRWFVLLKDLGGDAGYHIETGGYWESWRRGSVDSGRMRLCLAGVLWRMCKSYSGTQNHTVVLVLHH